MSRKLLVAGVLALLFAPGVAWPLGLGDIRLNSYLNQPIDAEIALSVASAAELETLRVELAPADAFSRYGIARPAYFDELRFQVQRTGPASAVVRVSTTRPIAEPFLTFLVEARWGGGRTLREYTILLDPPVFLPAPAAATAPAPAPVVEAPRPAPPPEPAPVARPAPAPAAAPAAAPVDYGREYGPVQRNETLWAIAQRVRPDESLTNNQVMIALFRANPGAFDGNINRLRAGAVLRLPSRQEMAAATAAESNAEFRRQMNEWRQAAAAPVERRLELAPPAETARPAAPVPEPVREAAREPVAAPVAAPGTELLDAVQQLRDELADTRRLMEVKDAEIAALQARLAELEAEAAPATGAPAEAAPAPAVTPPAAAPAPAPAPAVPSPSLGDRLFGLFGNLWLWLAVAIVLIGAAVLVVLRKRKEETRSIEQDLAETGTWGTLEGAGGKVSAAAAGVAAAARGKAAREETGSILVEESAQPAAYKEPPAPERPRGPARAEAEARGEDEYQYPFEDTIAGESGVTLDQSDPLAEADFHMAYGLYDQAAEIIRKAVEREPDRYDLRRKLLDICFVWGNAEEFLVQAKAVREMPGDLAEADWGKIAIMGRQICPGEALFAGEGAAPVDVEISSTTMMPQLGDEPPEQWLDFDVGEPDEALQALGDTREQPAVEPPARKAEQTAELDLEELGIDLELGETGEYALKDLAERAPEFADESGEYVGGTESIELPAEVEEDEQVEGTMMLDSAVMRRASESPTERGDEQGWELSEDEPTLTRGEGFEETGEAPADSTRIGRPPSPAEEGPTVAAASGFETEEEEEAGDHTLIKKFSPSDEAPTTEVGGFEDELDADLDLADLTQSLQADLDETGLPAVDDTQEMGGGAAAEAEAEAGYEPLDTQDMPSGEINEVATKLDLARAYVDMGDPDGARSILEEVLEEGDEAQRQEARELIDSLG